MIPGLREATDADGPALQALVGGVFAEYPGCVLDLDDLDDDLVAPRSTFAARGSRLWVVEEDGRLVACVGVGPVGVDGDAGSDLPGRVVELKRLYVTAAARGRGLGTALVAHVHAHAAVLGAAAVELWSDTRFRDGHRRYLAAGYEQRPARRELHDPSDTTEAAFWRRLDALAPAERDTATTTGGASVRWARWSGHGGERVATTHLASARLVEQEVVADEDGRTRRAVVRHDGATVLDLRADGLGSWWRDGEGLPGLDGCHAVDLPGVPAPSTGPVVTWRFGAGTPRRAEPG